MNIKSVKIQNFKCFGEQQNIDFERLTILTGANSSGKSSILYSVLGSLQSEEFPLQFSTNGKYVNMGDFTEISYNHNSNNEITLGFTFKNGSIRNISSVWIANKQSKLPQLKCLFAESDYFKLDIKKDKKYSLNFNYYPENDPSIRFFNSNTFNKLFDAISSIREEVVEAEQINVADNKNRKKKTKNKDIESLDSLWENYDKPQEIVNYQFVSFDSLKKYYTGEDIGSLRLRQVIERVFDTFESFDRKVNYISSFRLHPERTYLEKAKSDLKVEKFGEGYLDQIIYWETKKSQKFDELISVMRGLSLIEDIQAKRLTGGRFEMLVKTRKDGAFTSLSDVGFGISQFLPIIVADLQLPEDSTLFVAQPEIHLHPSVQSLFGKYITDQINSSNKSYVVETHSEYFLNSIRLSIVKGQLKKEDVSVYFIDNQKDGPVVHKIVFEKNGQIVNAPKNFFETYMMDVMEIALNAE